MVVVKNARQLKTILKNSPSGQSLVAGTARIYRKLQRAGFNVVNVDAALDERKKSIILNAVAQWVPEVVSKCDEAKIPRDMAAILQAGIAKALFGKFSHEIFTGKRREDFMEQVDLDFGRSIKFDRILRNINSSAFPFGRTYHLNFCSSSGNVPGDNVSQIHLSPKTDHLWGLENWITNTLRGSKKNNRFRIDVHKAPRDFGKVDQFGDQGNLEGFLQETCFEICANFFRYKLAAAAFVDSVPQKPELATFNHVGDAKTAGFASALAEARIPTEMASHGAMVVHGGGGREKVASALANCIYNWFPGMDTLVPRSPLQVPPGLTGTSIRKAVRVRPSVPRNRNQPFTILYAPNFLPFHSCYHGISASCFETRACAEGLVAAFRNLENSRLNIRIKTTVKDVAKINDTNENRGLLPDDLDDLYDPDNRIYDTSLGPHSALLSEADLVVTEGVTAVMFEALENRKPVLLLNQSSDRIASLPATRYCKLAVSNKRSAVYASGVEKTLPKFLERIRGLHMAKPLTDQELSGRIWL